MNDMGRYEVEPANADFAKWATGFSGCDGGDIGSVHHKSIWFCGIEWGGGHPEDEQVLRNTLFAENVELPDDGYTDWKENTSYIFNRQALKLLSSINGGDVSSYKEFAETMQPFVKGATGYFKMNLYPLSFKNTSHEFWKSGFAKATGFAKKQDYLAWIKQNRFPVIKSWVAKYSPKMIVCVGKSYIEEYSQAFADDGILFKLEIIDERELNWAVNRNGTIVVVIPFMINPNGLIKDVSIQKFGDRIRGLLLQA